jgi:hypothetical protein
MNTPAQLRLAADLLETGHPMEWQRNGTWYKCSSNGALNFVSQGYPIRPVLATPPYPATLHNPDNLTAEQVGVGYRLITADERRAQQNDTVEYWNAGIWRRISAPGLGWKHCIVNTYRLPLSVPWPEQPKPFTLPTPPPGIPWTEWPGGECPLKDEEVEEWERKYPTCSIKDNSKPSSFDWQRKGFVTDIIAYRVLKTREPKPKVPLGPEDVPPGSVVRPKHWSGGSEWIGVQSVRTLDCRIDVNTYKWERLQKDFLINRSIPQTGKWDATKWEACEK